MDTISGFHISSMLTRSVRTGLGQVICKWNILATPSVLVAAFCFLQGEFLWTSGADVGLFLPVNLAIQSLASSLHIDAHNHRNSVEARKSLQERSDVFRSRAKEMGEELRKEDE